MAVEVLGRFKNKKRILVTPGIVELGDKMYEYNKIFGNQAADNCDYVILVGQKQAKPIYDGLIEKGFEEEKIFITDNFDGAMKKMNELMDSNTVILLENDLSDNYL
jgi:UDP-N-acetylmuramoyl-tripeptide--D-alanyl-D-alanine ligase